MQALTNISQAQAQAYKYDLPLISEQGYQGESVRLVQKLLLNFGYSLTYNAIYDSETINALQSFQTNNNLASTGQVDVDTWHALTDQIQVANSN